MKVIMHDLYQKPVRQSELELDNSFQNGTPATLLVVDDEPIMREIEVLALAREGYQVLSAAGPAEALRLAAVTSTIDLLLTDYSMPEANGIELVRRFRTVHPKTPVLMVSGSFEMLNQV